MKLDYKILKLLYRNPKLKVGEITKYFALPRSTIGSTVKRLEEKGLVSYERYQSVNLTAKGRDKAVELFRHAQLIELFLYNELNLSSPEHSKIEN